MAARKLGKAALRTLAWVRRNRPMLGLFAGHGERLLALGYIEIDPAHPNYPRITDAGRRVLAARAADAAGTK
jgi:hypothetical protein